MGEAVPDQLAGGPGLRPPGREDQVGCLLHHQPGAPGSPGRHAPGQVGREGELACTGNPGRPRVAVDGHHVQVGGPVPDVHRDPAAEGEVGGDRSRRAGRPEDVALRHVVRLQRGRQEPAEVQCLRGVGQVAGGPGSGDLGPVGVALAPEAGRPRLVERGQVAVTLAQPVPEGGVGEFAVAVGAVLVVHVPHGQRRVPAVPLGEGGGDLGAGALVRGRVHAVGVPAAVPQPDPLGGDRQRLRVGVAEPGRRGRRRSGQDDPDARRVQAVQGAVQPAPLVPPGGGLQARPAEHADGDQGDPGLAHQPDVGVPDRLRPLLRVVVAAVPDHSASTVICLDDSQTDR
jgi:hypothetical protein